MNFFDNYFIEHMKFVYFYIAKYTVLYVPYPIFRIKWKSFIVNFRLFFRGCFIRGKWITGAFGDLEAGFFHKSDPNSNILLDAYTLLTFCLICLFLKHIALSALELESVTDVKASFIMSPF